MAEVLNTCSKKPLSFRPYNPQDEALCHEAYERFKKVTEALRIPVEIDEKGVFTSEEEGIDDYNLLKSNNNTVFVTQNGIRNTFLNIQVPGKGNFKTKSIVVSSLGAFYSPAELEGVVLHEVIETLFGIRHHPNKGEPCAMVELNPTAGDLYHALENRTIIEKLNQPGRYKQIPIAVCSECRAMIEKQAIYQ